jgi:hypothetical protein
MDTYPGTKWLILLYDLEQAGVIVECPSGVRYRNQVGGNACFQAEEEGVLAPLELNQEAEDRLETGPYPGGGAALTDAHADAIDGILASHPNTSFLKVDRARLRDSMEAWVYVILVTPESTSTSADLEKTRYFGPVYGFGATKGVLTWPNSD